MKLRDSLVNMLGDFVQMNKNPEFRSKTDVSAPSSSPSGFNGNRRHSLNITVGAQGPPESLIHHRHSICPALMRNPNPIPDNLDSKSLDGRQESAPHSNRRQSEPAIKSAELHSKIKRLRNQSSLCSVDSDEENDSDGGASEVSVERRSYHSDNGTFSSGFSADKGIERVSFSKRKTSTIAEELEEEESLRRMSLEPAKDREYLRQIVEEASSPPSTPKFTTPRHSVRRQSDTFLGSVASFSNSLNTRL